MDFNPLWILVVLTLLGLVVKGLFWLRDVQTMKTGWAQFTTKTFPDFAQEIRNDIKEIFRRLPLAPAGVKEGSPLTLTDFGQKMSENMDARAWAEELAPTLQAELVGKRAFEVDAFSRRYVYEQMREDARVAKCMYEMAVEPDNALNVLHVVLRDRLIAALGISPDDG